MRPLVHLQIPFTSNEVERVRAPHLSPLSGITHNGVVAEVRLDPVASASCITAFPAKEIGDASLAGLLAPALSVLTL